MKLVLGLAVLAAVTIAFQNAGATLPFGPKPAPRVQLIEVEQQKDFMESFNSLAAGSDTQSVLRSAGNSGGVVFSSTAYALFDNHNADGTPATIPIEVDESDSYRIKAVFVRSPSSGIVQLSLDNKPLGRPFDGYAAALEKTAPIELGRVALSEGKHRLTLVVTGKNAAATDYQAGLDLVTLESAF